MAKQPTSKSEQDVQTWVDLGPVKIRTITGEEIEYAPRLNLGKELELRKLMSEKLSKMVEMFTGQSEDDDLPPEAFSFLFQDYYEVLPDMIAVVISSKEKPVDREWVLENLDGDTCQEIIAPFFASFLRMPPIPQIDLKGIDIESIEKARKKSAGSRK